MRSYEYARGPIRVVDNKRVELACAKCDAEWLIDPAQADNPRRAHLWNCPRCGATPYMPWPPPLHAPAIEPVNRLATEAASALFQVVRHIQGRGAGDCDPASLVGELQACEISARQALRILVSLLEAQNAITEIERGLGHV